MNKRNKFILAILLGIGIGFFFDNNFGLKNSYGITLVNLDCNIDYNEITNKSSIKDSAPKKIELAYSGKILKLFSWDGQKLEKHFEILKNENLNSVSIGSKGYSDIKNAVFFDVLEGTGYLYQFSIPGVNYFCKLR